MLANTYIVVCEPAGYRSFLRAGIGQIEPIDGKGFGMDPGYPKGMDVTSLTKIRLI